MLDYIKDRFEITVIYAGVFTEIDSVVLRKNYPQLTVVALEPDHTLSFKEHGRLFEVFIDGKKFDIVLIEYIDMAFVLPTIDRHSLTILDTHDLVADRIRSFKENNIVYRGIEMSDAEEVEIFNCFDRVLLIKEQDYLKIGQQIGFDTAMLVPHAAILNKRTLNAEVRNIGFVASEYLPNVEAITWFLRDVWPAVAVNEHLTLNIYGNVCHKIPPEFTTGVQRVILHAFVDDVQTVYDQCDIMINPVKFGAGLKIKNIETMACGLPLVTTVHGGLGICRAEAKCFLVADSHTEFVSAIRKLVNDADLRRELGSNAYALAGINFSAQACYGELVECMLEYELTE